jgi:parvulin-like peptidyl-prolyl isomerase
VNIWNACLITPVGELCQEPVDTPYGVHIIFRTG